MENDYKERNGLLGIGMSPSATMVHQNITGDLYSEIRNEIYDQDLEDKLKVVHDFAINPSDLNTKRPDVCIFKKALKVANYKPLAVIEITTKREYKISCEKVIEYFDEADKLKEAFVYDYETDRWSKFTRTGEIKKTPSFLNLLKIDLADIIKKYS